MAIIKTKAPSCVCFIWIRHYLAQHKEVVKKSTERRIKHLRMKEENPFQLR